MTKMNLLLVGVLTVNLLLAITGAQAGFDLKDLFKKKDADVQDTATDDKAAATKDSGDYEQDHEQAEGARPRRRLDLSKLHEAQAAAAQVEEDAGVQESAYKYPKRPNFGASAAQERNRRRFHAELERGQEEEEEKDEAAAAEDMERPRGAIAAGRRAPSVIALRAPPQEEEDAQAQEEEAYAAAVAAAAADEEAARSEGGSVFSRFKNKQVREQLAARYISTHRGSRIAEGALQPRPAPLSFHMVTKPHAKDEKKQSKTKWLGKQFNKALEVTKKGIKAGADVLTELPSYVASATDTINAFLQLDGKGKLLSLIDSVEADIHFVRKEFSQFTLTWSPIMEQALNYLGDQKLDKIKFNERDELDLKKDALHSLALGYEFMRLFVAWREQLLMAHEAYKQWLESLKAEYENKRIDITDGVIMQLGTVHTYLLLTSWEAIDEQAFEARAKLDQLMDIEDERPKNYESEYFRNIIVLQEMYIPTAQEMDKEHEQVSSTIATSGVVVDNLEQVDEFYQNFRESMDEHSEVDCHVPVELTNFLDKLKPQLEYNTLVYPKGFIDVLKQQVKELKRQQQQQQQHQHQQQ